MKNKKKKIKPLTIITWATEKGSSEGKLKDLGKKVTVTTNNRIQAGFHSARRWEAKHWTQNQLTTRMHN